MKKLTTSFLFLSLVLLITHIASAQMAQVQPDYFNPPFFTSVHEGTSHDLPTVNGSAAGNQHTTVINTFPYGYGFGTTGTLDPNWSIVQVAGTGNWALAVSQTNPTMTPYQGPYMLYCNAYSFSAGAQSRLVSPQFDFTGIAHPQLSFYMTRDNGFAGVYPDSIMVESSTNNGTTWVPIVPAFQRVTTNTTPYWEQETVDFSSFANNTNVTFGIRACCAFGDNFSIDTVLVFAGQNMIYSSSTTNQLLNGVNVSQGTNNNQIIQVPVVTSGAFSPLTLTSLSLGTNGSTAPATDITNAKVYYTGTSATFSTANLFGTFASPNGTFAVNGTQVLANGTNYFWVTYDVPGGAVVGHVLDAQCNSVTIGSVYVPTVVAPAGSRPIAAPLSPFCGVKNIPGDYSSLTACVTDLNTVGVLCPTTINIAAGYRETVSNLILTCPVNPPNSTNTLTFKKNGAGADPLLTAGTGVSTTVDGIIILNGVSYVTFDGIDLQDSTGNITPTTQMEWGYALVKQSATVAPQHCTIQNCNITLFNANTVSTGIYTGNHTAAIITALTITNMSGTTSYNHFYNNKIQNCYFGYQIQGYASPLPYDFYDQYNEIGTIAGGRSQVLNFGGGLVQTIGINVTNQNGMKVYNTNVNTAAATNATVYGIFGQNGINSNIDIYGDTVTVASSSTGSASLYGIANSIGSTGTGNTVNIYNNVVNGCTYPTNVGGTFYGVYTTAIASYTNVYGNKVSGNTIPGTGSVYCMYVLGSGTTIIQQNIYNNIVSGNVHSGSSGALYMLYTSATTQLTQVYGNQLFNNSNVTSTSGSTYGYYNNGSGYGENIYNNSIYNNAGGTTEFDAMYLSTGGPADKQIYGNQIYGNTGNGVVGGIYIAYSGQGNCYNNNIYNQSTTYTLGAPGVFGIEVGTSLNYNFNLYNNFISDLRTPASTSINSIWGLWLAGSSQSYIKAYYNTVYLNASSTSSTTFGTTCLYCSTTPVTMDLRNNILVNSSIPGPTGGSSIALQRGTSLLTNYNLSSGNNCLYAGTPSANHLIYFDGTNSIQNIQLFINYVSPREGASFSTLPPFVNIGATPYDLHMQTGVGTQCESGGQPVAVTTDYDGTTRSATFPDVGADEFSGIMTDIAAPLIAYNNITNGGTASPRVLTSFANITDPSGVNTAAGTKPRIYYKKSTQANTFNDNTSATDGWKYVEASNAASPFSFSVDYTRLLTGSVVAGDIIQYFVIAQDQAATPNVGINSGGLTLQPTSVNLTSANFPLVNTINQYSITANTYSGTINVGTDQTITSLTNAGGIFNLLNTGALSGNVTINITTDLTAELGTYALNQLSETGPGGYTVTIQPSAAVVRTISGAPAVAMVRFDGAKRVTIDGRFGGSGSYFLFRNTSTAAPTISFINEAQNITVRNCIIEGANTSTVSGVVFFGTTTSTVGNGNSNNTLTFNEIRNRTDVVANPCNCIYSGGSTTVLQQYNKNNTISNNNIHDFFLLASAVPSGITISTGNTNWNIDSNSVYETATYTFTTGTTNALTCINISNSATTAINGGFNVRKNYCGGSAPLCTGTWNETYSGTAVTKFNGINIITGLIPNFIQNNQISNIALTMQAPSASAIQFSGIGTGNGINNITGNLVGSTTTNDNIVITANGSSLGYCFCRAIMLASFTSTIWGGNIDNNSVGGISMGGTCTPYGCIFEGLSVYTSPGLLADASMSNNLVGSTTVANSIRTTYTVTNPFSQMLLMRIVTPSGVNVTCNNNTFQNITEGSAGTSTLLAGIIQSPPSSSSSVNPIITNNTFANFNANTISSFTNDVVAIQLGSSSVNQNISGNTIAGLNLTNTGAVTMGVCGMFLANNASGGTFSKNKIYGLTNQTSGSGLMYGMYFSAGNQYTLSSNMISLTNGQATDEMTKGIIAKDNHVDMPNVDHTFYRVPAQYNLPLGFKQTEEKQTAPVEDIQALKDVEFNRIDGENLNKSRNQNTDSKLKGKTPVKDGPNFVNNVNVFGIYDVTSSTNLQSLYNTIYVGGVSGSFNSFCYFRGSNSVVTLKDNLFYNNRTGTGFNYAIGNENATPSLNWIAGNSNYNAFVTTDSLHVCEWGTGVNNSIDQWRTNSLGDAQTWATTSSVITPASLFTNVLTGDLHILSGNAAAWLVSGKGIALTGQGTDIDGNARSTTIAGGVTDIGADEFAATPPSNPVAFQSAAPSSGGTTNYTLYGRTIASVTWGTGGVYPTSLAVNYYSGVSPSAPNVSTPNKTSNSYWTFTPTGSFANTTFDATIYYGDNETFTITSPATNVLLAKNDYNYWMGYPRGVNALQSDVSVPFTVKTRGLFKIASPTSFTLTDAANPAEILVTPVNAAINQPAALTLVWRKSALATNYRVQLSTDSLFNTLIVNDSTLTDSTKAVSGLLTNTRYWWRVNGKFGTTIGPWSQVFYFNTTTVLPPALVNMNVIPGGFYNTGTGKLNMRDTLRIILVDSATCNRIDSNRVVVDSVTFGFQCSFSNANTGTYYIMVFHRNHIPISSRLKQTVTRGSTVAYDFTNDSTKTYGLNVTRVAAGKYGMIPGDANQDQFVDGLDQTIWIAQNGFDGFLSADFNGDGFVDGLDQTLWIIFNGNSSFLPCNIFVVDALRWEKEQIKHKTVGNIKINPLIINGSTRTNK